MIKKLYARIVLIVMAFVLVGCITIPLGNNGGVIKISESGIEYVKEEDASEDKSVTEEEDEDEDEEEEWNAKDVGIGDTKRNQTNRVGAGGSKVESSTPVTDDKKKKVETKHEADDEEEDEEEEEENKPFAYNPEEEPIKYEGEPEEDTECNYDYSEFTDYIGTDIYIPYCAIMVGVEEFNTGVTAGFLVDLVSYDHIKNNYRAFFGLSREEYFDADIIENPDVRSVLISGRLKDGGKLYAHLEQRLGYVNLLLDYQ